MLYVLQQHQATFNGLLKRDPNQRPFVLSRAAFAGSQRYGKVTVSGINLSHFNIWFSYFELIYCKTVNVCRCFHL